MRDRSGAAHEDFKEIAMQRSGVSGADRLLRCAACAARTFQVTVSVCLAPPLRRHLRIDPRRQRLAGQPRDQVVGTDLRHRVARADRGAGDVRRDDRCSAASTAGRPASGGSGSVTSRPAAKIAPDFERLVQRLLIHDRAAGRVDQHRRRLHLGEGRRVEHAARLSRSGRCGPRRNPIRAAACRDRPAGRRASFSACSLR